MDSGHPVIDFWKNTSDKDLEGFLMKSLDYGSYDLYTMGDALSRLPQTKLGTDKAAAEMGVMFYILGKVARALSAYREGRLPSDDTLHDISVYAMMARMLRKGLL